MANPNCFLAVKKKKKVLIPEQEAERKTKSIL
jgi:hypothetical protein